jgi:hypothetical protein
LREGASGEQRRGGGGEGAGEEGKRSVRCRRPSGARARWG